MSHAVHSKNSFKQIASHYGRITLWGNIIITLYIESNSVSFITEKYQLCNLLSYVKEDVRMSHQSMVKGVMFDFLDITTLSDRDIQQAFEQMSVHRQKRVSGFALDDDIRRSVGADLLGRKTAAAFAGCSPDDIMILQLPSGQPVIKDADYFISLSHAGKYAMCAVSHRPVGADIESPDRSGERVCRRFCSEGEKQYIYASGKYDPIRFATVWTAKEAIVKTDGRGLSSLSSLVVADADGLILSTEQYELINGIYCGMIYTIAADR